jgi:predicted MFS family arabinose efflux permease
VVATSRKLGRTFWQFWTASALANVGDGIRLAAFPLLAASISADPFAVGVVVGAQALPWLVTGLLAGALADTWPARALIAGADTARVVVLLLLMAAVVSGWVTVAVVAISAFLLGVAETVRDTSAQTAVPRLVPRTLLERANGRLAAGEIVGNEFVGPPVGSMLFVAGAALPFAVNGVTLALAVMLVLSLPLSVLGTAAAAGRPERGHEVGDGVRAGLAWLVRHRMLRVLVLISAAVAAADSAWFAILVLYTRDVLGLGEVGYGVLLAVGAAGGLLGSFVADRMVTGSGGRRRRHRSVLTLTIAVSTGVPALLVISPQVWAAVVVVVVTSGAFAIFNVAAVSLRQRLAPMEVLGRVTAASRTVVYGSTALGAAVGGGLASIAGIESPLLFSAAIAVGATLVWWIASRPQPGDALVDLA